MGQKIKSEDSIVCRFAGKELSVRTGSSVPTRKSQIQELVKPGPLKCFSAPRYQSLAKSAPQKARNRDKAEFATKERKSS